MRAFYKRIAAKIKWGNTLGKLGICLSLNVGWFPSDCMWLKARGKFHFYCSWFGDLKSEFFNSCRKIQEMDRKIIATLHLFLRIILLCNLSATS